MKQNNSHEKEEFKLKPCPFCDNKMNIRVDDCDEVGNYPVRCFECYSTGPAYGEKARAVKAWNTRPRESELTQVLMVAKESIEAFTDPAGNMPSNTGEFNDLKCALEAISKKVQS